MKAIMVPVADRPECANALKAAFDLAERFSGNVLGYHVRPHQKERRNQQAEKSQPPYREFDWQSSSALKRINLDSKNAKKLFDDLALEYNFKSVRKSRYLKDGGLAIWHNVTGDPEHIFSIIGPLSDIIIVSRPRSKKSFKARAFAYAALTRSSRPVLYLPNRKLPTLGNRILIAWNQSEQSAAAVMTAIPLLVNAESVAIVAARSTHKLGPGVKHLQHYLSLHGVESEVIKTPGASAGDEIVQVYQDTNSDLLLMGAYSRPKWRERLFGGVTHHILEKTTLPTLMLHNQT